MDLFGFDTELGLIPRELGKVGCDLRKVGLRFERQIAKQESRGAVGRPRVRPAAVRLPSPPARRPLPHRLTLPRPHGRAKKPAVTKTGQQISTARPAVAVAVEQSAQRVAAAVRDRLLALRQGLGRLRRRFNGGGR